MKKIRIILLLHIVFFIGWAGFEEYRIYQPKIILLKTAPVDPRDLLSGYYMILNYEISNPDIIADFRKDDFQYESNEVFLYLKPSAEKVVINNIEYTEYKAMSGKYNSDFPVNNNTDEGVWVKGRYFKSGHNIIYGIERYYFGEHRKDELNKLPSGSFYVEIYVGKYGDMRISRLIY